MSRNISLYLRDILENMRDAEAFIEAMSYDGFAADKKTFNAVVYAASFTHAMQDAVASL